MSVLEFLESEYEKTKWPFFYANRIINDFPGCRGELNKLVVEGKIKVRAGANGRLIELIK